MFLYFFPTVSPMQIIPNLDQLYIGSELQTNIAHIFTFDNYLFKRCFLLSIRSHNYSNNNNNKDFINLISETCSVYSDYALFDIDCAFYVLLSKSIHGYSSNLLPEPICGQTKPSEPHLEVVSIVSSVSMIQCILFTFSKTNKRTGSGFKKVSLNKRTVSRNQNQFR